MISKITDDRNSDEKNCELKWKVIIKIVMVCLFASVVVLLPKRKNLPRSVENKVLFS